MTLTANEIHAAFVELEAEALKWKESYEFERGKANEWLASLHDTEAERDTARRECDRLREDLRVMRAQLEAVRGQVAEEQGRVDALCRFGKCTRDADCECFMQADYRPRPAAVQSPAPAGEPFAAAIEAARDIVWCDSRRDVDGAKCVLVAGHTCAHESKGGPVWWDVQVVLHAETQAPLRHGDGAPGFFDEITGVQHHEGCMSYEGQVDCCDERCTRDGAPMPKGEYASVSSLPDDSPAPGPAADADAEHDDDLRDPIATPPTFLKAPTSADVAKQVAALSEDDPDWTDPPLCGVDGCLMYAGDCPTHTPAGDEREALGRIVHAAWIEEVRACGRYVSREEESWGQQHEGRKSLCIRQGAAVAAYVRKMNAPADDRAAQLAQQPVTHGDLAETVRAFNLQRKADREHAQATTDGLTDVANRLQTLEEWRTATDARLAPNGLDAFRDLDRRLGTVENALGSDFFEEDATSVAERFAFTSNRIEAVEEGAPYEECDTCGTHHRLGIDCPTCTLAATLARRFLPFSCCAVCGTWHEVGMECPSCDLARRLTAAESRANDLQGTVWGLRDRVTAVETMLLRMFGAIGDIELLQGTDIWRVAQALHGALVETWKFVARDRQAAPQATAGPQAQAQGAQAEPVDQRLPEGKEN